MSERRIKGNLKKNNLIKKHKKKSQKCLIEASRKISNYIVGF